MKINIALSIICAFLAGWNASIAITTGSKSDIIVMFLGLFLSIGLAVLAFRIKDKNP